MEDNRKQTSAPLRSYGRRKGRKLKASQTGLMETLLPSLLIKNPSLPVPGISSPEGGGKSLWFEIGFGGGEHLVEQARRNPGVNFIGCEPYINGMASLLASIDKHKLTNVRLYDGDARDVLEALPDNSLERVFLLFPDPWPKARHHKRRIVTQATLELLLRKIIPGGLLRIATDHEDYGVWMLEQLLAFGRFEWTAKRCADWQNPPQDWVITRYQAKAEAEGRGAVFLDWRRPDSVPVTIT